MHYFPRVLPALLLLLPLHPIHAQQLTCQPCTHGFGRVVVGSSKTYFYTLVNTGNKSLKITSKSAQGSGFSLGTLNLPVKLNPGASVQLPVIFTPSASGWRHGSVTLVSTGRNSTLSMSAGGTGMTNASAELSVTPSSLDFGSVIVGNSTTQQATLSASNGSVTVSSDQSSSSEFSLLSPSLPVTLAAGQSIQATLQFTPNAAGTASGKIKFISTATNSPSLVSLTGTGVPPNNHRVALTWDPSASQVVGYNVYRGDKHNGPYSQINSALQSTTSYTDTTVAGGSTYYYVATAVDSEGVESQHSNEAVATVPNN